MSTKSFNKSTSEWVLIRKKLYNQIKSEVIRLLGVAWDEFIPLEVAYAKELSQAWRSIGKHEMMESLMEAQIILMGDFHALQQSQRGHLRILREWSDPSQQLVLAVEFFQARHQKYINQWMKGTLLEKKFLEKIQWEKNWGFPWEHYKPLLDWAKKNQVPVLGINWGLKQKTLDSLKMRENYSAMCVKRVSQQFPHRKIIVIYGDLHLAKGQLLTALKKYAEFRRLTIKRVFQNSESLYFQVLHRGLESKIELIQFKSGDFCVQSVPPWVKWQSYLLFLEKNYDRQIDEWDSEIDHTDHVAKLVDFLCAEFKLKFKPSHLAIYTANDTQIYAKMRKSLKPIDWLMVRKWITDQRSFYLPQLEIGYLGQTTVNHTATLAGEYVHSHLSKRKGVFSSGVKDFERHIWLQAISYLGSKVINHKRKTNTLEDLKKTILMRETNKKQRQVLLLALQQKVREIRFLSHGQVVRLRKGIASNDCFVDSARLLGSMMGEKIYFLYHSRRWSLEKLKKVMRYSLEDVDFPQKYYKILREVNTR